MKMKQLHLKHKLKSLINSALACHYSSNPKFVSNALGGKSNFEKDFLETHIETTYFQKVLLGLGSGFMSITDPRRGDMVAVMGESTGALAFDYIRSKMLESEEGRKILEDKPRISSASVDLEKLKQLPEGTLGKAYSNFLERYKYSPDERLNVRFVDDIELAYIATRYREGHDLFHTILDMPTNMLGEVTVKWVEAIQTKLPMCVTGAFFGPLRLAPKFTRTYSTKVRAILDSDVTDGIKTGIFNRSNYPGKVKNKCIQIPENIEKNILAILEKNDGLKLYNESKKFQASMFSRTLLLEGITKQHLLENCRSKILEKVVLRNESNMENINEKINAKIEKYSKALDNLRMTVTYDKNTCLMYLMSRAPYEYAALVAVLREIYRKDPEFKPNTLLDFGSGVGTVIWAAKTFWGGSLTECMTIDASEDMNNLCYSIVHPDSKAKPLVKNLIQRQYFPTGETDFDIVVSGFTFFELPDYQARLRQLCALWNKTSKYLIMVENGTEHGFQIIKEARDMLLQQSYSLNFKCHVVAPCPHDFDCPMQSITSKGCRFLARYTELNIRKGIFHNRAPYSYVIFKKGKRSEGDKKWPRIVSEVLPRHRHIVCNFCSANGQLNMVPISKKKYDKSTYELAKWLKWGDCFPGQLCAVEKTIEKEPQQKEMEKKMNDGNDGTVSVESSGC